MLNKLHIEIENNIDLSHNYTVMINGKVINMEKNKDILEILVHVLVHTFPYLSRDLRK